METSEARNSSCRLMVCAVRKVDSATCTVQLDESCPMTSGHRKEFQLAMKVMTPIAAKKFSELGTTIRQYAPQYPRPSTRAASSSSFGKPRKYCRNRKAVKPLNSPGTISPRSEETHPSEEASTKLGTKVTALGIISEARIR